MEDEDEAFDSFDDDVEELILLTAKPKSSPNVESELQSAQGENAILRSRLELLEKEKFQDVQKLKEQFSSDLNDKVSKIQAYQELTIRLEDEKKFLKSELNSLSARSKPVKKRKMNDDSRAEVEQPREDVIMVDDSADTITQAQPPPPPPPPPPQQQIKVIHQSAIIPNEKQLFIEAIYNHVINGASDTTLNFLSKIVSPFAFKHESFNVSQDANISTSVINYLVQLNNNIRLDNLISEFIEILTIFIQKLYLNDSLLPIPFLLTLVHCSLNYRPSALHNDIIEQLLQFNADFLKNYLHVLKPTSLQQQQQQQQQPQQRKKSLQYIVLDQFIVMFSLDIIELLSKLSYTKQDTIRLFWKLLPKEIIKSSLSNSTSINFVFNMVEILTYSITSFVDETEEEIEEDEDESFIKDDDILLSMTKLLIDGMPLQPGFRIYGLNRIIGNNDDIVLLQKLIPQNHKIKPCPILNKDISPISLPNQLRHELQCLNVKLKILKFFEIFLMNNAITSLKFEFIIELIKILIWVLLKEQEYLIRNPRSDTVYSRNLIINTIVKIIHFIILRNDEISQDLILPKLSNDDSYNFIIALTRISFSSSSDKNLNTLAFNFLSKLDKNFEIPIFNEQVEKTNYLQDNLSIKTSPIMMKKNSILTNNNGLEISFDDDIIEMSRDLIELYTTAIELDNLYFAMNKIVESNEIDELMMEYLNDDDKRR